jgi:hypothetical protein
MSDRDTYLEKSLQGEDDSADSGAPEGAVGLTALDELLEGLPPLSSSKPTSPPGVVNQPSGAAAPKQEAPLAATAFPPSQPRSPELPIASPSDILGVAEARSGTATRFDMANEIKDIAAGTPSATSPSGVASGFVSQSTLSQDSSSSDDWQSTPSFAAIAQEIAATVDSPQGDQAKNSAEEPERSGVFLKTKGRRRRARGGKRAAVLEIVGLILVLVVGLGAEYEYVARGHQPDQVVSTVITIANPAPTTPPALPRLTATAAPHTLFHFSATGEGASAAFAIKAPFVVNWTVTCPAQAKPTAVYLLLQNSGKNVAGVYVAVLKATSRHGSTARVTPGSFILIAKSPSSCAWTFEGRPSA